MCATLSSEEFLSLEKINPNNGNLHWHQTLWNSEVRGSGRKSTLVTHICVCAENQIVVQWLFFIDNTWAHLTERKVKGGGNSILSFNRLDRRGQGGNSAQTFFNWAIETFLNYSAAGLCIPQTFPLKI